MTCLMMSYFTISGTGRHKNLRDKTLHFTYFIESLNVAAKRGLFQHGSKIRIASVKPGPLFQTDLGAT